MRHRALVAAAILVLTVATARAANAPVLGGPLPGPLPLFPPDNWWNLDVSGAPLDPNSANFIAFIGSSRQVHPDFGGEVSPGSAEIYGFPYAVVDGTQPKQTVQFDFSDESDGVDHNTNTSFPFYPIPDEAITQAHWIEEGDPGNVDLRASSDRHLLIVDKDNKYLYELYNVFYDGTQWLAGSGAFFDMKTNNRRPEGWTSADAAGLAILPGLVRYDEVYQQSAPIGHAFRVTVSSTNGHVFPASHDAGSTAGALPMGARLRLKASTPIGTYPAEMQRIFSAMKTYGLIVADNGSDMYVSGTFDTQWNNDVLNPAFGNLHASDFEVVQLGYNPPPPPPPPPPTALCQAIVSLPFTIRTQGRYCLVRNLSTAQATGAAITVASDFVVLDMKGFKIGGGAAGAGTQAVGIYALNRRNVTIRNGNVRGFLKGVFLEDTSSTFTTSQGHLIENVRADQNTFAGIHVQGRGDIVRNNQVVATTGTTLFGANSAVYGIASDGAGARVINNDVTDTIGMGAGDGVAIALGSANGSVVERNRIGNAVLAASSGIRINGSSSVLALRNRLAVLGAGIEYLSSTGRYRDNLQSGVSAPYTGGTDAGNNR